MSGRWLDCFQCKEQIYLTDGQEETLRRNGNQFFCRWGHGQVFRPGKTDAQIAREERDEAIRERDLEKQRSARYIEERDAAERRASAARGQVTRMRNRASAGVCPCCTRTFQQLARHMKAKHPDFQAEVLHARKAVS